MSAGLSTGFGVADDAGFVDVFVAQADLGNSNRFRIGSGAFIGAPNLAPLLSGVVFVGEAALGAGS